MFSGGGLELSVDPRSGSVVRLSLEGKNVLVPPEPHVDNYVEALLEGSTLVLKAASGSMTKRFRLDTARRSVEVTYTATNATPRSIPAGALDSERVPAAGGLTFFPGQSKLLPGSTLRLNVWQPVVWFEHEQARDPKTLEASVESSEGWVATLHGDVLLVKVLSDPGKPTIFIAAGYDPVSKQRPWVEVGERSSFELPPGASATSTVRLFLRKLPSSIAAKPGNQELIGFVRGIIQ